MKRTIRTAGLAVLPRSGHVLNLEDPALFNHLLEDFFHQVESGRWSPRAQVPEGSIPCHLRSAVSSSRDRSHRVRAGPTCVKQFADWGADVIKVEMPCPRARTASVHARARFQNLHRNKRSLTLNLKDARGVDVLARLVRSADVLVENFRPDVKHKLKIDYETLAAINPN
jgi:hypothetical protein